MHPYHRITSPSQATPGSTPSAGALRGIFAAFMLLCFSLVGCGPEATTSDSSQVERFRYIRAKMGIVRVDTSTGAVATVPLNGDGGWTLRGAAPDLAGQPARNGRFDIMNIVQGRQGPNAGQQPVLLRVDRETGRTWLLESEDALTWLAIRDPEGEAMGSSGSNAGGQGATQPTVVVDEGGELEVDAYPILTGDQLGTTPEEKQKTLETLRTARTKDELPEKMRIWAVRQIGQVDPELAVPELLEVLNDPDPVLVVEAIKQLGAIGRASTIPQILKLEGHPDPRVRAAVAEVVVEVQ